MTRFIPFLILTLFFYSCVKETPPVDIKTELPGSWDLYEYVDHLNGKSGFRKYDDTIVYQKHITAHNFTWFKYDRKNVQLLGMGGGSYTIKNGQYVENIEFFYPPGSNELGQAIPFTVSFKNGNWYHTGYAKILEPDPETSDMVAVDSIKIEEIWRRTKVKPNEKSVLYGSWDLNKKRDSLSGSYFEYPDFIGYMKLITPTHFVWINYDKDGDEIYGTGSGPYTFIDGIYSENIQMVFPANTGQLNETVSFECTPYANQWKHYGLLPHITIDTLSGKIIKDMMLIDEVWNPHVPEISEEIEF